MNFQKLKLVASLLFLLFTMGFTAPIVAQGKTIIGKKTPYKKYRNTRSQTKIPSRKTHTKSLAQQITRSKTTDVEKAKSIFIWIATTIQYDTELRLDRNLQKEIYTTEANVITQALRRKKALCGGYAFLFKQLCEDVGIKAEVIHGYTKQGTTLKKTSAIPEHTWNAVFLNGTWELLDITWAISHGNPSAPHWFWYCTKPSDFIKTHVPQEKKWQLTATGSTAK